MYNPDEKSHCAAFHLGLYCFSKHPFRGFQYTKSYKQNNEGIANNFYQGLNEIGFLLIYCPIEKSIIQY